MHTQLIDRFLAACGTTSPLPLRVSCPGWKELVVRKLHQPFVVLGRDPRADLCLNAPEVSPSHAYLQVIAGSVFCVDLQSETGTHWSGIAGRGGWLNGQESIRIGPFAVQVAADELEEADGFGPPREWNPLLSRSSQVSRLPEVTLELVNIAERQPPRRLNRLLALVGSAPGCNVRLVSSTVSHFHCSLLRTPMGLWVVDLLGGKGVRVNGTATRYALLRAGDELQAGKFRLRVAYETPARAVTAASAENGHSNPMQGASAATLPGSARNGASDLAATSVPEMMLARREETLLVPLVQQFQLMQQQMFDQFQQAMFMVVQMFSSLHREQTELIRRDLERVHSLTKELQALQSQWKAASSNGPESVAPPATVQQEDSRTGAPPAQKPAAATRATNGPQADAQSNGEAGATPDDRIHAWLSDRIATLQQERQTQWQKIVRMLGGK